MKSKPQYISIEKNKVSYEFKTADYKNCASVVRPAVRFSVVDKKGLKREYRIGKILPSRVSSREKKFTISP